MKRFYHRLKLSALSFVMALLFSAGVLLSGSDFVGFPWGPLIGTGCWGVLGLLVLLLRNRSYKSYRTY